MLPCKSYVFILGKLEIRINKRNIIERTNSHTSYRERPVFETSLLRMHSTIICVFEKVLSQHRNGRASGQTVPTALSPWRVVTVRPRSFAGSHLSPGQCFKLLQEKPLASGHSMMILSHFLHHLPFGLFALFQHYEYCVSVCLTISVG